MSSQFSPGLPQRQAASPPVANPLNLPMRSRLTRQETATGRADLAFGSDIVIVHNKGPISVKLGYDGREIAYPAESFVPVPAEIAWFHWGVLCFNGKFERPKHEGAYFWDRLSSYAPLFLWQKNPDAYEKFLQWFSEGVEFKVSRPKTLVESTEWDKLEGGSIN